MPKSKAIERRGRPTDYTAEKVRIFVEAFCDDLTVAQACLLADVSERTFYEWMNRYPEFSQRINKAREFPAVIARKSVQKLIREGDGNLALRWLQRRDPEFKEKVEVEHHDGELEKSRQKIQEFLNGLGKHPEPVGDQESSETPEPLS